MGLAQRTPPLRAARLAPPPHYGETVFPPEAHATVKSELSNLKSLRVLCVLGALCASPTAHATGCDKSRHPRPEKQNRRKRTQSNPPPTLLSIPGPVFPPFFPSFPIPQNATKTHRIEHFRGLSPCPNIPTKGDQTGRQSSVARGHQPAPGPSPLRPRPAEARPRRPAPATAPPSPRPARQPSAASHGVRCRRPTGRALWPSCRGASLPAANEPPRSRSGRQRSVPSLPFRGKQPSRHDGLCARSSAGVPGRGADRAGGRVPVWRLRTGAQPLQHALQGGVRQGGAAVRHGDRPAGRGARAVCLRPAAFLDRA